MDRIKEWDTHVSHIDPEYYRSVDLGWARKFHSFYGKADIPTRNPFKKDIRRWIDRMYVEIAKLKELHVDEDMSVINNCRVQVAKILGKPTTVHIHGALAAKHGFAPITADKIAIWDERQIPKLLSWGIKREKIVVEGIRRRFGPHMSIGYCGNQKVVRKHLKLPLHHQTFLVAPYTVHNFGDGGEDIIMRSIEMIKLAIESVPSNNYVIKLHPGCSQKADLDYWKPWVAKRKNMRLVHKYNPWKLLMSCDGIIAHNTTYAIDAMVLGFGKKVIAVDDGMPSGYEEFLDEMTVARNVGDIVHAIQ